MVGIYGKVFVRVDVCCAEGDASTALLNNTMATESSATASIRITYAKFLSAIRMT